ncbi:hypothetical protein Tco_0842836 [Tanacetum coccineum]|uniref:ATP-dependent DNA helicase n=1 Tax=Tanacetum coccineum TaxID=301880 RepID=A0ABQ5B244_9ASTR
MVQEWHHHWSGEPFLVPFSTALAVMYGARENGTTTGVVSRSIFSCRSLAPENGTTVPYTLMELIYAHQKAILAPTNEVVDTINDHLLEKFTNGLLKLRQHR